MYVLVTVVVMVTLTYYCTYVMNDYKEVHKKMLSVLTCLP